MIIREVAYEHHFTDKVSIAVQILSWTSPLLIYLTNGFLINITMKQRNKSALDMMMLMDSILCIFNSLVIIRTGLLATSSYEDSLVACYFFNFFNYFVTTFNRLVNVGIVVYRFVFVLQHSFVQGHCQRKKFIQILFSSMFVTSTVLTGFSAYYKDSYYHHLRCSGRLHQFYYNLNDFYENSTLNTVTFKLPKTHPFNIINKLCFVGSIFISPIVYLTIFM